MAKPIRKTPTLTGKEAENFIIKMIETEKRTINNSEKELMQLITVD